ncbi:hypothetical protein Fot_06845 [Forsythia ovata]|uniref:Uncharacterized protein n=1 Tax=Forsythia ovata TaxID=205694 RepID=A0ABD1WU43_9LAMI
MDDKYKLGLSCIYESMLRANDPNTKIDALESRDTVEVLDDPNLHVRCKLHASLDEGEQEYVRSFVSSPRREDPILDSHLYEDGEDGDVGDEEHVDVFEDV